jgi:hypothetical protein
MLSYPKLRWTKESFPVLEKIYLMDWNYPLAKAVWHYPVAREIHVEKFLEQFGIVVQVETLPMTRRDFSYLLGFYCEHHVSLQWLDDVFK